MLEIFQYDFVVRAFVAGMIIGIVAPLIGMFLVVRRLALIADTLAHVSLVGVAGGILLNISPVVGALVAAILAAIGIEKLRGTQKIFGESILALFLSGSLALAAILFSLKKGSSVNIANFLFGSIMTVQSEEIWIIAALGILSIVLMTLFYKEFAAISFDEDLAKISGIRVKMFNILLILLAAITIALAMRIVGILLIGALMVIPIITAMQIGKSFRQTLILSIGASLLSVFLGIFLSFYLDISSGGTIVAIALILFVLSLFTNSKSHRSYTR